MKYSPPIHLVNSAWIEYSSITETDILNAGKNLSNTWGRHDIITEKLGNYLSDYSLQRERVRIMIVHLIKLSEEWCIPNISDQDITKLLAISENFSDEDYIATYQYDHQGRNEIPALEHDVKAVEYFLREKFEEQELGGLVPYIHMFCTSEDVNNIAYQIGLRDATNQVILPKLRWVIIPLLDFVEKHKSDGILWRTHGQEAVPTTFWKLIATEMRTLQQAMKPLINLTFSGKFSWATWSNADHKLTFPDMDWLKYEEEFVNQFGLRSNIISDQRGPLIERVQLFQILENINNVLINLAWKFHDLCARRILVQKQVAGEVGSSVMPGKTNPWRLEEMEWVLKLANTWFKTSIDNHTITRRERDLAEHPLERNYGEPFGQMLIGITNFLEQISRFEFSSENANEELDANPEVIGSGMQSVLRSKWISWAYNFLAKLMKDRNITLEEIQGFVTILSTPVAEKCLVLEQLPEAVREMESKLTPEEKSEFYNIVLDDETSKKLSELDPKTFIWDSPARCNRFSKEFISHMWEIDTNVSLILTRPRLMAVGWDFDDTLYIGDKEELEARVRFILWELSIKASDDEIINIVSKARWDEQKSWMIKLVQEKWKEVSDEEIEQLQEQAKPQFNHLLRMDDYAIETLDLLQRKDIPQFLITNRWPKTLSAAIEKHDLNKYFEYTADGSHELKKPDPALMQEALDSLGISAFNDAQYIWDHPELDVHFSQNSWITPIHVNRTQNKDIKRVQTVKNMWELFRKLSLNLL